MWSIPTSIPVLQDQEKDGRTVRGTPSPSHGARFKRRCTHASSQQPQQPRHCIRQGMYRVNFARGNEACPSTSAASCLHQAQQTRSERHNDFLRSTRSAQSSCSSTSIEESLRRRRPSGHQASDGRGFCILLLPGRDSSFQLS